MSSVLSLPAVLATPRVRQALAGLALGLAGWGLAAPSAQAADVYWSIGVHQPGVSVGVSNTPPVVVVAPPRVVYAPPPRVVYAPAPVVVVPHPVQRAEWVPPGHRKHWHKDRHHGHRYEGEGRRGHRH